MLKMCRCGNEFEGKGTVKFCSDECRIEARRKSTRDYQARQREERVPAKSRLSEAARAEKFTVKIKTEKGTVVLRKKERRAVRLVPANGEPIILMEYLTERAIDTICPPYIRHTFRPITADSKEQ